MTLPIGSNYQPPAVVHKSSNGKESSTHASSLDKTLPPTSFSTFKKVFKRSLTIAFLPFVIGYKVISKSMAERRFMHDHVLPKIEKAIAEAKKNNQSTTEPLFIGSFTIDPIDLTKSEGLSAREILVDTLNEMKSKNKALIENYRSKIKSYIHADFSMTDDKGNAIPSDPSTKKIFVNIEQNALRKIKLHNQKAQREGQTEASKAEELVIVQTCIKDEMRALTNLIATAKKANLEGENSQKIQVLEASLALVNDYSDAIKNYSALKITETRIEDEIEKCRLTPFKNFFKALGITLATMYFGLMWTPLIPLFALIGLSNAAVVAGTGRDLTLRKYEEIQKKSQLPALDREIISDTSTSAVDIALISKTPPPSIGSSQNPSTASPTNETIATREQDEHNIAELNKIIDRLESQINEIQAEHKLDIIIESLDNIELDAEYSNKSTTSDKVDPYQFIDQLIEKIDKGVKPSP